MVEQFLQDVLHYRISDLRGAMVPFQGQLREMDFFAQRIRRRLIKLRSFGENGEFTNYLLNKNLSPNMPIMKIKHIRRSWRDGEGHNLDPISANFQPNRKWS